MQRGFLLRKKVTAGQPHLDNRAPTAGNQLILLPKGQLRWRPIFIAPSTSAVPKAQFMAVMGVLRVERQRWRTEQLQAKHHRRVLDDCIAAWSEIGLPALLLSDSESETPDSL